ncbi:NAD(P)-dependent oxidoreductase [Nakamurella sp. GG22]
MRVAVLGTGIMGAGVAGSLLRSGHQVTVWNRDPVKAEPLRDAGAVVAPTPPAAVGDAEAVLTVLHDADAVLDVMAQAALAMPAGSVWAQLSTIGLDGTARTAVLAQQHGIAVVEAMMLGTKQPAEQGKLVLLVGGDPAHLAVLAPVFEAISAKVVNAGEQSGQASALKLAANAWVQSLTAIVGQSLALTSAFGLDPQKFLDAIGGGATDSPYAHVKGAAMLKGEYPPSFSIDGVLKDLGLIRTAAQRFGVPDDVLERVEAKYAAAARKGHAGDDMAAVYTAFEAGSG